MKVTKSLFMALAGLALFSCQKEEGIPNNNGNELLTGENSSVFLKLGGLEPLGRSLETPTGPGSEEGTTQETTLSSVALLFVNPQGEIMKVELLSKDSDDSGFSQFISSGKDFEGVPGGVKKVYAVGNYKDKFTVSGEDQDPNLETVLTEAQSSAASKSYKNISEIDKFSVGLSKLQDVSNALVYGNGGLQTATGSSEDAKKFTCTVEMKHLVSRLEVQSIACTDMTESSKYSSITLKYIGIGNYYINTNVDGTVKDTDYMGIVRTGDHKEKYNKIGILATDQTGEGGGYAYVWGGQDEFSQSAKYKWSWDEVKGNDGSSPVVFIAPSSTSVDYSSSAKQYSYSFVPKQVPTELKGISDFNIKLVVDAKERGNMGGGDSEISSAFTTVTGNFAAFDKGFYDQPGKILKVKLSFAEDNISGWDPDQENQVKVSVTVQDWKIYANVTPTYE